MKQNGSLFLKIKLHNLKKLNRAVFLDRDGVINRAIIKDGKPYAPTNLKELEILHGVTRALDALHKAGWLLIVVTNQPDVARGKVKLAEVKLINKYLKERLPISRFYTCYHDNDDRCECRKPLPGSLLKAKKLQKINLYKSYMIGDRWSDIEAGNKVGCTTIFIDYNYNERLAKDFNYKAKSLFEAAKIILEKN
jgi:D-glycero-D-manno-heptose 1,7-bisphosphate phosphatase